MNIKSIFAALALIAFMTGCNSMKVTSEQDRSFDFGTIQTYQWIDGPAEILDDADTYINEDIQKALNTELANRGLRQTQNASAANVQVAYYVKLKEEQEYTTSAPPDDRDFSGGFVYNRESKSWSYAEREPDLNVYAVEVGTLTVLIYDAKTGKRIWKGKLKTEIDRSRPEDKQLARIRTAAEKLMARLPATAK